MTLVFGSSFGRFGLVVFEEEDFRGEAEGIIWSTAPLPRLTASHRGREDDPALREEAEFRRTQSTESLSGSRGREKLSDKLTKAHSGSRALRIAEDGAVAAYYRPRAFKELREMEGAA